MGSSKHTVIRACLLLCVGIWLAACSSLQGGKTDSETGTSEAGTQDTAASEATGAVAAPPPGPAIAVEPAVQQQFDSAVEAMRSNRVDEARPIFERLMTEQPALSGPVLNLGILARADGDRETATKLFQTAIERNPRNLDALNFLGVIAREDGRFDEAETWYRKALAVDPNFDRAHLNLGILLDLYRGELQQALTHYETYQGLQPEPDPDVKNWIFDLKNRLK